MGQERVLLIDDDEGLLHLLKVRLTAMGFQVVPCTTPEEALEEARGLLAGGDDRHELGRTLALLARTYSRLPAADARRGEAAALRDQAVAIFTELGAALDLRRLETEPI